MKKLNTSPISGMLELLPNEQAIFNKYKTELGEVFKHHGFLNIETPVIDRQEILLAKAGGETEKQIYKVIKTEETENDADQALRFDHTVPLARYVTEHENDLTFPFKVSQVGRNYRGERAQKGRFREFYQLDIDVIGRNELPVEYDAEVIYTLFKALEKLNLPSIRVRVSNRKILSGLLEEINLNQFEAEIFKIVDRSEKVPMEVTKDNLSNLGIGDDNVVKITTFMDLSGSPDKVIPELRSYNYSNPKFNQGVDELEKVLNILNTFGLETAVVADMKIVRGLDYYTGTVFETIVPEYKGIGSICSGGRYENLASLFTDQVLPGVGGSIGLTRLFFVLKESGLIRSDTKNAIDLVLIPFSENELKFSFELAEKLRNLGKIVDINLSDKKVGDKFKYAGKIAKYATVIGEKEIQSGEVEFKNLESGELVSFQSFLDN